MQWAVPDPAELWSTGGAAPRELRAGAAQHGLPLSAARLGGRADCCLWPRRRQSGAGRTRTHAGTGGAHTTAGARPALHTGHHPAVSGPCRLPGGAGVPARWTWLWALRLRNIARPRRRDIGATHCLLWPDLTPLLACSKQTCVRQRATWSACIHHVGTPRTHTLAIKQIAPQRFRDPHSRCAAACACSSAALHAVCAHFARRSSVCR